MAKAAAVSLADYDKAAALEERFLQVEARAGAYAKRLPELLGLCTMALELGECRDFLSTVVSDDDVSALNKHAGQFFTPREVSYMMAQMTLSDLDAVLAEKRYITIQEPACGAGGMLLAVGEVFREKGHDPTTRLWFQAIDVAPLCYQMTYIQTSLTGMAGTVMCMDALVNEKPREAAETIGAMRFIARNGVPFRDQTPTRDEAPPVAELPFALEREASVTTAVQGSLF